MALQVPPRGREKRISLGTYPDTSLQLARKKHAEARNLLADGKDPSEERQAAKAATASKARSISDNTLNACLRRLGYAKNEVTAHGFRAVASTLLTEQGFADAVIELQLAHAGRNEARAAYRRDRWARCCQSGAR